MTQLPLQEQKKILTNCLISMHEPLNYKVGDLVRWKKNLRNRKIPNSDQVAIVIRIYEENEQFVPVSDFGSPYYGEKLTIRIGVLDEDNDMLEYDLPGWRLEKQGNL